MAHDYHAHEHHSHSHAVTITSINRAFIAGIVLNLIYVVIQIIVGININSLSLLSDAGHNLLDVTALILGMIAFKLVKSKARAKFTYGHKKASILISLVNALVLLISIGAIGYESMLRIQHPPKTLGNTIALIAFIGIILNGISAYLFFRDRKKDLNIKSSFLHQLSDTLVSLGLVIGGLIINYTGWYWIDPILSIIICVIIIVSTWKLLNESLRLSLDGVPSNLEIDKIKETITLTPGVVELHHLHVWAISTNQNALTGHLVVEDQLTALEVSTLKDNLKHTLEHLNIQHATLETELKAHLCHHQTC